MIQIDLIQVADNIPVYRRGNYFTMVATDYDFDDDVDLLDWAKMMVHYSCNSGDRMMSVRGHLDAMTGPS